MIEDHQIGFASRQHGRNFLHLALAGEGLRVRTVAPAAHFGNHDATRRLGQQTHLFQLVLELGLTEIKLNDHRAFAGSGSFNHGGFRNGESETRRSGGPWGRT